MFEQLKTKDALETPQGFLEVEREKFGDIAEDLIVEKNSERRHKRASRLSMAFLSTLVALGAFPKSQEVAAQEPERAMAASEIRRSDLRTEQERRIKSEIEEAYAKLEFLESVFDNDPHFGYWLAYSNVKFLLTMLKNQCASENLNRDMLYQNFARWHEAPNMDYEGEPSIEIRGFESVEFLDFSRLSNERVENEIRKRYPENFLRSVGQIVFVPTIEIGQLNELEMEVTGTALSIPVRLQIRRTEPTDSITIFKPSMRIENQYTFLRNYLLRLLDHELGGHSNDWESSVILSPSERLMLIFDVVEQYQKPTRFSEKGLKLKEEYWVRWREENESRGTVSYIPLREYWGHVVAAYFDNPSALQKRYPDDYALVARWVEYIRGKDMVERVAQKIINEARVKREGNRP